jgi:hypothetical protein
MLADVSTSLMVLTLVTQETVVKESSEPSDLLIIWSDESIFLGKENSAVPGRFQNFLKLELRLFSPQLVSLVSSCYNPQPYHF